MTVKYKSINQQQRTVTLELNESNVTRNIPDQFEGTIDEYITSLAQGLEDEALATPDPKTIENPSFSVNEVIIA